MVIDTKILSDIHDTGNRDRLFAEHPSADGDRIYSDIPESPTAFSVPIGIPNIVRILVRQIETTMSTLECSEFLRIELLLHGDQSRLMQHGVCLTDELSGSVTESNELFYIFHRKRERFLAKDMLSCLHSPLRPRYMEMVRQWIIYDIYGGIGKQLLVGAIRYWYTVLLCILPCLICIT